MLRRVPGIGKRLARLLVAVVVLAAAGPWAVSSWADEGMWMPQRLENCPVDSWHARGLEIDLREIHTPTEPSLTDAIVKLGGGTGSFVSIDGLIVTNHHVAYRAIQRSSEVDADHLADGFVASTRADEIALPGFEATVLVSVDDVTDKVNKAIKGKSGGERFTAMEKAWKKIVKRAEKDVDVYCEVKSFYGGSEFFLYTYFKVKDVRLVFAPPQAIGEFGGDIDNWMWPRHTGDFSFVRAYVAPDGKSAEYTTDNVPYHPRRYLSVSNASMGEGDFTMVIGYPGSTRRYRSSHAIDFFVDRYYPRRIEYFGAALDILEEESARGRDVELKLTGTRKSLANAHKNYLGMLDGLRRSDLLGQKIREEEKLARFMDANPELKKKYGSALGDIGEQYADYQDYWELMALMRSFRYVSMPLRTATEVYKWAVEQEKDDIDRDRGYQDRDREARLRSLEIAGRSFDGPADRRLFEYFMGELMEAGFAGFAGGADGIPATASQEDVGGLIDRLYTGTVLTDDAARVELFGKSIEELMAMNDPFIEFAAELHAVQETLDERYESFSGELQKLRPRLIALRAKYRGGILYPDANSTMRLSVGEIKGYSPRDAINYGFQTVLSGLVEKHTGERPFDVPEKLLDLYESRDFGPYSDEMVGEVPVCFLSTNDVTGGNSGSPILNGRGELIGLVFDGNFESISADYQFIPRLTRTINVDSRYILFVLDKFSGADALLEELKIVGGGSQG